MLIKLRAALPDTVTIYDPRAVWQSRAGMAAFGDENDYLKINITTIVFRRERQRSA